MAAWFVVCGWCSPASGETPEEAIWRAQTPTEIAECADQIKAWRARDRNPSFPFNADQLHAGVGVIPTDPDSGIGGCRLTISNWTGQPVQMEMQGVLMDHYGKMLEEFSGRLELAKDQAETKVFTFPVTSPKRHRLTVTFTDPATGTQREMRFFPQLDCVSGLRKEMSLNGSWKTLATEKPDYPPAEKEGWKDITVPQPFGMAFDRYLWFSRTFSVPPAMQGSRLALRFEAIGLNATVFVNGRSVGESADSFVPFEMDVTDAVKIDGENVVMVRVSRAKRDGKDGKGQALQPYAVSEGTGCYDVRLYARPEVFILDRFVRTSVREKSIAVTTWITNGSSSPVEVELRTTVMDDDRPAKTLKPSKVVIQPGETKTVDAEEPWADPHLWWPHDPFLYRLRSELAVAGTVSDRADLRFGFREIWCQGPVLKLNGKDAWLRRYSEIVRWCGAVVPEKMGLLFSDLLNKEYNSLRFHMEPPPEYCVDIADEMGMLVVIEGGLYNNVRDFAMENETYWQNVKTHLQGLATLYRNHPSVIMYSPENEWAYINISGIYPALFPEHFPDMSRDIKAVDPTRPLCYDSDDDAAGTADTRGLHYPQDWDARWPLPNHAFFNLGDKPVILGEFMMSEGMVGRQHVQIVGDRGLMPPVCSDVKAYNVGQDNHNPYMRKTVAMFCDAYRLHGVAGMNPWFFREETWGLMPAVLVTAKHLPRGFTGGSVRDVPLNVLYDVFADRNVTVRVYLDVEGNEPQIAAMKLNLVGGERPLVTVKVGAPSVDAATPAELVLEVIDEGGKTLFNRRHAATVFPDRPLVAKAGTLLLDPDHRADELGRIEGVTAIGNAKAFDPSAAMLIVAPDAGAALSRDDRNALDRYVEQGGKVFVMAQGPQSKFLPANLPLDEGYEHTFAFVRAANHPVLRGMRDCDFAGWGLENWVVRSGAFLKPDMANSIVLVESGSTGGLEYAPMAEVRRGRGSYILCQLAVAENLDEPAVRHLVQNVLSYADTPLPDLQPLYVLDNMDPKTAAMFKGLGATIEVLDEGRQAGVVLVDASGKLNAATVGRLKSFAESGGTVWLHRLTPETLPDYQPLVGAIEMKKTDGAGTEEGFATIPPDQLIRAGTPALLDGIGQRELTWSGIADYVVEGFAQAGGRRLTVPAGLVLIDKGKGRILIDQINWQNNRQILSPLMTHLNVALNTRQAYTPAEFHRPIDLSSLGKDTPASVTDPLKELLTTAADPRTSQIGTPIVDRKEFGGIPFFLTAVSCDDRNPKAIDLKATLVQRIAFLFAPGAPDRPTGQFTLEFTDGSRIAVPVTPAEGGEPVWQSGDRKASMHLLVWSSPDPDKPVKRLTLRGDMVVAGITAISDTMRTAISPASAAYLKDGKRQESSSSIAFHRNDRIIWKLEFISSGRYWITLSVRTGNAGPTDMMAGYHLKLNGRELPLIDSLIPIRLGAFASDASWKDWRGSIRTAVPMRLKPGDRLELTTDLDWSVSGPLTMDMLTRIEETRQRDAEHKFGAPRAHELVLDLEGL